MYMVYVILSSVLSGVNPRPGNQTSVSQNSAAD